MRIVAPTRILRPGFTRQRHCPRSESLQEQQLDRAIIGKAARGEHARVVQHQQVAGRDESRQLRERAMLDLLGRAMQHHHARVFAARQRTLRDQLLGQRIIVIGQPRAHAAIVNAKALPLRKQLRIIEPRERIPNRRQHLCSSTLEQIRAGGGRWPKRIAARALEALRHAQTRRPSQFVVAAPRDTRPSKAERLAPIRARVAGLHALSASRGEPHADCFRHRQS